MSALSEHRRAIAWLLGDDTGISSKAILAHMLGRPPSRSDGPRDPADLARCLRLLRLFPEWQDRMDEMRQVGSDWDHMVPHWRTLSRMLEAEMTSADGRRTGKAPLTYGAMQSVRLGGVP